jgi:hypothetical protein
LRLGSYSVDCDCVAGSCFDVVDVDSSYYYFGSSPIACALVDLTSTMNGRCCECP